MLLFYYKIFVSVSFEKGLRCGVGFLQNACVWPSELEPAGCRCVWVLSVTPGHSAVVFVLNMFIILEPSSLLFGFYVYSLVVSFSLSTCLIVSLFQ